MDLLVARWVTWHNRKPRDLDFQDSRTYVTIGLIACYTAQVEEVSRRKKQSIERFLVCEWGGNCLFILEVDCYFHFGFARLEIIWPIQIYSWSSNLGWKIPTRRECMSSCHHWRCHQLAGLPGMNWWWHSDDGKVQTCIATGCQSCMINEKYWIRVQFMWAMNSRSDCRLLLIWQPYYHSCLSESSQVLGSHVTPDVIGSRLKEMMVSGLMT